MTASVGREQAGLTPKRLFLLAATAEAITWALLIAGMLQKYVFDAGEWGVSVAGGLHGFVFLAYVAVVVLVSINQRFGAATVLLLLASAIVPFATIVAEVLLRRSDRLEGAWRTEASDDPRDARVLDRLIRWLIARPALLGAVLAVGVVAVFGALIVIGPPGGRDS